MTEAASSERLYIAHDETILCACFTLTMLTVLFSCGNAGTPDGPDRPRDTAASDSTATPSDPAFEYEPDDLPASLDFEGEKVVFLTPSDNEWFADEISVEELRNDVLNDSVYNREIEVEERLGVEIEMFADDANYDDDLMKQVTAGDDDYQLLAQRTLTMATYILPGYLRNLYDLEDKDYLNLEKPWWSQRFNEEATLENHLFMTTGSLSLSLKRFLFVVFYNKKMAEDFSGSCPELLDMYSLVNSGEWTFDRMVEIGGNIYQDVNGNSEVDGHDLFGIGHNSWIDVDAFWSGFDIRIFEKDEDGWPVLSVNTDKLYAGLKKISDLLNKTKGCYNPGPNDIVLEREMLNSFCSDSCLFMINRLYVCELEKMRNMSSEYGVIPYPKFDANQKEYYSYAHDQYTSYAIPVTCGNVPAAAAVLEAMASYSYRDTEPAYLDIALKGKYMNDPQSRQMIDIVVNGFRVDAAWIYTYSIGMKFPNQFRDVVTDGNEEFASTYAAQERIFNRTQSVTKGEYEDFFDTID